MCSTISRRTARAGRTGSMRRCGRPRGNSCRRSTRRSNQERRWCAATSHCRPRRSQIELPHRCQCHGAPGLMRRPPREKNLMPHIRTLVRFSCAILAGVSLVTLTTSQPEAQYRLTVNRERLLNASNEPQNWLMMNGDYSSHRYSKLTQINRDNVKNLRMVWALALRGMQNVGQNGPDAEVNPLIDNGFMYTSDGWGTIYKIDARNPNKGEFVWIQDNGVRP